MTRSVTVRFRPPPKLPENGRALWLDAIDAQSRDRSGDADLPRDCDVCVVGGGFTGLWAAIQLKKESPSANVVLLEAGICGGAASGRNGGFVMTAWSKFGSLAKLCGIDDALTYGRAVERAVGDIGDFCEAENINADFHQSGWIWAATNEAQLDSWNYTVDELEANGEAPFVPLGSEEVAARTGSPVHIGGLFEAAPATVDPCRLVRGLVASARRLGVTIIEGCAIEELQSGPDLVLSTTRGKLRADKVILGISAWTSSVPDASRSLVVVSSDVIATPPVPNRLEEIGWQPGLAISDSRRMVNYYRTTAEGRIVFGKGGGDVAFRNEVTEKFDRSTSRASTVLSQFHRAYPMLQDVPIDRSWRGAVDYSVTGLPFIGPVEKMPGVFLAAGFSGNGVGPSYVAGKALAQMALGQDPSDVPEGLRSPRNGHLPPEPVRYLAGRVVRGAVRRKEDAEDAGKRPGPITARLSSLDPTSFVERGSG